MKKLVLLEPKLRFIIVFPQVAHLCRYLTLAIARGKTMPHKWPARGKTMIKCSLRDLLIHFISTLETF